MKGGRLAQRDAVCVLTDDHNDIPTLSPTLQTDAGHIGAMGGRRTHEPLH